MKFQMRFADGQIASYPDFDSLYKHVMLNVRDNNNFVVHAWFEDNYQTLIYLLNQHLKDDNNEANDELIHQTSIPEKL